MVQFSVNLSTIFTEVPFIERFKKAREAGFSFVECQFPYEKPVEEIKKELEENNLSLVLINLPPGNWEKGERGLAIDPNKTEEFCESVQKGIEYAISLNVPRIHCMAGNLSSSIDEVEAREVYLNNIQFAAKKMAEHHITLLIEPINPMDMPNYFLSNLPQAIEIIDECSLPNVKLQFDFYHMQKLHGNLIENFSRYFEYIGHVQIADVPGRHQPGTGEIQYNNIFTFMDKLGYNGYVGLEYTPQGKSDESFHWMKGE